MATRFNEHADVHEKRFGISGMDLAWYFSYRRDRTQTFQFGSQNSRTFIVYGSVPQRFFGAHWTSWSTPRIFPPWSNDTPSNIISTLMILRSRSIHLSRRCCLNFEYGSLLRRCTYWVSIEASSTESNKVRDQLVREGISLRRVQYTYLSLHVGTVTIKPTSHMLPRCLAR